MTIRRQQLVLVSFVCLILAVAIAPMFLRGGINETDGRGRRTHITERVVEETATAQPTLRATPDRPAPTPNAPGEFIRGYRDHGGRSEWEAHFIEIVIPCEGDEFKWDWRWGDSDYLSILQFYPGTWGTAAHHTGHSNPENLYHVGANSAYWSSVVPPSSSGGWADCWTGG